MKANIIKFDPNRGDYPEVNGNRQTAHIRLTYKGKQCATSALPTDIPIIDLNTPAPVIIRLDTQGALGDCWNEDISTGQEKMIMDLKLPSNSPIAVNRVMVIDENNHQRCWTSYWRTKDSNYNTQNNQWVRGKAFYETRYVATLPALANNFDGECIH